MLLDIMSSSHFTWLKVFSQSWLKFDQNCSQSGKGRGRPKKNAEPEVNKETAMMTKITKMTKMRKKDEKDVKDDDKDDDKKYDKDDDK